MLRITRQQLKKKKTNKTGRFCSAKALLLTGIQWWVSAVLSLLKPLYKAAVLPVTDHHTGAICLRCCVLLAHEALWDPSGRKPPYKREVLLVQSFLPLAKSQTFSQEIHQHAAPKSSTGSKYSLVCLLRRI